MVPGKRNSEKEGEGETGGAWDKGGGAWRRHQREEENQLRAWATGRVSEGEHGYGGVGIGMLGMAGGANRCVCVCMGGGA